MDTLPTLEEDRLLARFGDIRQPDGSIERVGMMKAYQLIDERQKTGFYASVGVAHTEDVPEAPEAKVVAIEITPSKPEITITKPKKSKKEVDNVLQSGPEVTGFERSDVVITKSTRRRK